LLTWAPVFSLALAVPSLAADELTPCPSAFQRLWVRVGNFFADEKPKPRPNQPAVATAPASLTPTEVQRIFGDADTNGKRIRNAIRYAQSKPEASAAERAADLEACFKEIKKISVWSYKRFSGTDGSVLFIGPGDLNGSPAVVVDPNGKIFTGMFSTKVYESFTENDRWPARYDKLKEVKAAP